MYLILSLIVFCSSSIYAQCQGDVNDDGIKNVVDVVLIVDDILSGNTACEEESIQGCLTPKHVIMILVL